MQLAEAARAFDEVPHLLHAYDMILGDGLPVTVQLSRLVIRLARNAASQVNPMLPAIIGG